MLKVLDQDEFPTFKSYLNAVRPYLDMVLDANLNSPGGTMKAAGFQGIHETMSDLSQDGKPTLGKLGAIIHPDDMEEDMKMEEDSRIEGLVNQRYLAKFAEAAMMIAQDLDDEGFDAQDIKAFLIAKLNDMILA
jgi:hypothetical protein